MPKIRIEFAKTDQVRFLSHLDMAKAFERAIRRANIPIAFSEGFNPHPKMNFASALAVGVTSDSEYMDIELKEDMTVDEVVARLAKATPPGIKIKVGRAIPEKTPSLMGEVNRAAYKIIGEILKLDQNEPEQNELNQDKINVEIEKFLNKSEVIISKRTKKGFKPKNIRPGILSLEANVHEQQIEFSLLTVAGNSGNVRPEEVICSFSKDSGLPIDCDSIYIKRVALYTENEMGKVYPLDKIS